MNEGTLFLLVCAFLVLCIFFLIFFPSWRFSYKRKKFLKNLYAENGTNIKRLVNLLQEDISEKLSVAISKFEELQEKYPSEVWEDLENEYERISPRVGTYEKLGIIAYRHNQEGIKSAEDVATLIANLDKDLQKFERLVGLLACRDEEMQESKKKFFLALDKLKDEVGRLSQKNSVLWHNDAPTGLLEQLADIEVEFCKLKASPRENEKVNWLTKERQVGCLLSLLDSLEKNALSSVDQAQLARKEGPALILSLPGRCRELSEGFLNAGSPPKMKNYLKVARKKIEAAQEMSQTTDSNWVLIFPFLQEARRNLDAVEEEIDAIKQQNQAVEKIVNVDFDQAGDDPVLSSGSSFHAEIGDKVSNNG